MPIATVVLSSLLPSACLRIFPRWSVLLKSPRIELRPLVPNSAPSLRIRCRSNFLMPPKALRFVVEYAKSNRSHCKSCSKTITANTLRLGSVSRDERGFDMTKWHHVECFGLDSKSVKSAGSIQGFDSLKAADQDALTNILEKHDEAKKEVSMTKNQTENQLEEYSRKKRKVADQEALTEFLDQHDKAKKEVSFTNEQTENQLEEHSRKERKVSIASAEAKVKISLSISDIEDKYKGVILPPRWKSFQTIIFRERDDGLKDSNKIAAFDFDGCLAKTSVKRIGANAWSLMFPSIPGKLQKLYNDGFKLVIFTNESNIERWKNKRQVAVESKIGRLDQFIQRVKVPMQVFIACGYDKSGGETDPFRKPKPGMWHIMENYFNSGIQIDMDHPLFHLCILCKDDMKHSKYVPLMRTFLCGRSFYVGDAAGRENDHSDADIKFAQAIGLKFYVPEDYLKP